MFLPCRAWRGRLPLKRAGRGAQAQKLLPFSRLLTLGRPEPRDDSTACPRANQWLHRGQRTTWSVSLPRVITGRSR